MTGFLLPNEMPTVNMEIERQIKGGKKRLRLFLANFRRQYPGNGFSDLLKNLSAKSPH